MYLQKYQKNRNYTHGVTGTPRIGKKISESITNFHLFHILNYENKKVCHASSHCLRNNSRAAGTTV